MFTSSAPLDSGLGLRPHHERDAVISSAELRWGCARPVDFDARNIPWGDEGVDVSGHNRPPLRSIHEETRARRWSVQNTGGNPVRTDDRPAHGVDDPNSRNVGQKVGKKLGLPLFNVFAVD